MEKSARVIAVGIMLAFPFVSFAQTPIPIPTVQTPDQIAALCQKAKQAAAARFSPDVPFSFDTPSGDIVDNKCIAAIINPALPHPNRADPNAYICVGKLSTITIAGSGIITDFDTPSIAVPAGTCKTTSCNTTGVGPCIPSGEPVSLAEEEDNFFERIAARGTSLIDQLRSWMGFVPENQQPFIPVAVGIRG